MIWWLLKALFHLHYEEKHYKNIHLLNSLQKSLISFTGCPEGYITLSNDHFIWTTFILILPTSNSSCHFLFLYSLVCFAHTLTIFYLLSTFARWGERNLTTSGFLWWNWFLHVPLPLHLYFACLQTKVWRNKCLVIFLSLSSNTVYPSTFSI